MSVPPAPPRKLQRTTSQLHSDKLGEELSELLEQARSLRIQAQKVAAETDHVRRQVSRWCGTHHDEYSELNYCSAEKRKELQATGEEILRALSTINVDVSSMRDAGQTLAYNKAIAKVESLEHELVDARRTWTAEAADALLAKLEPYLNACAPEPVGVLDNRFQSLVLGCSLMDQKSVRYRINDLKDDVVLLKKRVLAHPDSPPVTASAPSESPSATPTGTATPSSVSGTPLHGRGAVEEEHEVEEDGHDRLRGHPAAVDAETRHTPKASPTVRGRAYHVPPRGSTPSRAPAAAAAAAAAASRPHSHHHHRHQPSGSRHRPEPAPAPRYDDPFNRFAPREPSYGYEDPYAYDADIFGRRAARPATGRRHTASRRRPQQRAPERRDPYGNFFGLW